MPDSPRYRSHNAPKPTPPTAGKQTRLDPFSCSRPRTARSVLQNARGDSPIAQTLERDLGLLAGYLANARPTGHATLNFKTQSLGGRVQHAPGGQARDTAEAAKWLWKSIAKHNGPATLALADLYLKGDGVPKNCDQARVLLYSAARRGMTGAGERLRNLQAFGCQ